MFALFIIIDAIELLYHFIFDFFYIIFYSATVFMLCVTVAVFQVAVILSRPDLRAYAKRAAVMICLRWFVYNIIAQFLLKILDTVFGSANQAIDSVFNAITLGFFNLIRSVLSLFGVPT